MAPELLRVPPGTLTTAADVYAYGVLMWWVGVGNGGGVGGCPEEQEG